MRYIVVDLEATCWENRTGQKNEIIEIGAVMLDGSGKSLSEFNTFVKPIQHPKLSNFCTELTSITQKQVDHAPGFPEALKDFQNWIEIEHVDYLLCSWGFYDRKQFEADCKFHQLDSSWLVPHISLKHQHAKLQGMRRGVGMKKALGMEGFSLDGFHHRGIDDARNIAKIFKQYLGRWSY